MNELKKLRAGRGLLQKDVSAFLGVDRTTYVKYESGASEPPIAVLIKLADYYGVTVDRIVGHETPNREKNQVNVNEAKKDFQFSEMEAEMILRFRNSPAGIQDSIKKLLDIDPGEVESKTVAVG